MRRAFFAAVLLAGCEGRANVPPLELPAETESVLIALLAVSLTQRPRLVMQSVIAMVALAVAVMLATVGAVMSESMRVTPLPEVEQFISFIENSDRGVPS